MGVFVETFSLDIGQEGQAVRGSSGQASSSVLSVSNRRLIEIELSCQFSVGQPQPSARRVEPTRQVVSGRTGIVSEETDDRAVVPRQRCRPAQLPVRDRLGSNTQGGSQGSLPQAEIGPAAPDVIAKRAKGGGVTPW